MDIVKQLRDQNLGPDDLGRIFQIMDQAANEIERLCDELATLAMTPIDRCRTTVRAMILGTMHEMQTGHDKLFAALRSELNDLENASKNERHST
jgi:hypothetical protein